MGSKASVDVSHRTLKSPPVTLGDAHSMHSNNYHRSSPTIAAQAQVGAPLQVQTTTTVSRNEKQEECSSNNTNHVHRSPPSSQQQQHSGDEQSPRELRQLLIDKCREVEQLKEENSALKDDNRRLTAMLDELRANRVNDSNSLSHSRMSLASDISSPSMHTDASGALGSPSMLSSPWSRGCNTLTPEVSRKSSRSDRQRRYLLPMNDIEAYGKGLNPNQTHYIVRTPSADTNKDSLDDDELNGNNSSE